MPSCTQVHPKTDGFLQNDRFDQRLQKLLDFRAPLVSVQELRDSIHKYTILDAREKNEYELSHIPGALHVGYKNFNIDELPQLPEEKPVVVYCSVGYRSELVAGKLIKEGFDAYNLYGSLFEWANRDFPMQDINQRPTKKIHAYSKSWSRWIDNPEIEIEY